MHDCGGEGGGKGGGEGDGEGSGGEGEDHGGRGEGGGGGEGTGDGGGGDGAGGVGAPGTKTRRKMPAANAKSESTEGNLLRARHTLYPPTMGIVTEMVPPLMVPPCPWRNAFIEPGAQLSVPTGRKARVSPSLAAPPLIAMVVR